MQPTPGNSEIPHFDLYTYFRSSCSARLRIALNLHNLPYNPIFVHLLKDEQKSERHKELNPSLTVPVLVVHKNGQKPFTIPQSIPALLYIEDFLSTSNTHSTSLLPKDIESRTTVLTLVSIIASDVQPVTNLKVQKWVKELGADSTALSLKVMEGGFFAFESIVAKTAGIFSVGDNITLADVCLVPAVWASARVGLDIEAYPTMARITKRMEQESAVQKAHWRNQPDTPEEFRVT